MKSFVVSLWFYTFITLSSALLFPVAAVVRLLNGAWDPRLRLLHRFTSWWGSLYTWCNPLWKVEISGAPLPPAESAHVFVANHQSMADILVLFRLRTHYKWVSKAENFRIPFIGWNMSLNRYVRIKRGTVRGNLKMMRDCERTLRAGNSLMMFPEGTRSPDGTLRRFREGAFELAIRCGAPVLPIAIDGTFNALPKSGILLRGPHTFRVRILPAVPVEATSDAAALARDIENRIRVALAELRNCPPGVIA